jgi:ABC-2 type transport system ATP-binding protein
MPVDRPRRVLLEEPDDVESYVAKRSRGFTQADSGDRVVVRPARATRALEPSAVGTQLQTAGHDHRRSGSPPRRALPPESLSRRDLDNQAPTDTKTTGRRAIVDPEPKESSRPAPPSRLAKLLEEPDVELETPQPRRSVLLPPVEPVMELPKIAAPQARPADPMPPVPVQPPKPAVAPRPAVARTEPTPPYRPSAPIDRLTVPLPPTSPVDRPSPAVRRAEAQTTQTAGQINHGAGQVTQRARRATQSARQLDQGAAELTRAVPIRPASRAMPAERPAATLRSGSGQSVRRPPAPAVARPSSRPTVRREVSPIIVDRLIKSYNGTLAVHNLSFMVEPGRVTGFLGPNGAGKTTTMRILLGLVTPTTGTATFGSLAYADLPRPQRTVGCVLDAHFHPGRSGRNHLRVLAPTAGASDRRVDELLGEVGLGEVARQPVGEYSMGMQQRLALAAAMLGNPDYLILDEPANGLDPEGIRWLRTFLRDFAATGRVVFISSHLLNEIEATADDIVVINRGRLLVQVPMSELNLGEGTTRVRVSDLSAARQALATIGADVEIAADELGVYLRVQSHDVGQVGSALFGSGIVVDELGTERRDLEQEFFSMLEGSR